MQGSRCDSCRHAHIFAGYRESEAVAYCTYVYDQAIPVPFKVRECSSYLDKGQPTWKQMEDLALPIRETTTAKHTGFRPPNTTVVEVVAED
jgi:hypothetical protein